MNEEMLQKIIIETITKTMLVQEKKDEHPYVGKYIIVRSNGSGVHAGYLKSYDSETQEVYLKDSRRLWYWKGFTLSQCANEGMIPDKQDSAKLSQILPEIMITNVLELIPCTEKARNNIQELPAHDPYK
jgi:hypothetical protein